MITLLLGTNRLDVDQATFQKLIMLRDQLQQALPVLQTLNGNAPTNASAEGSGPFANFAPTLTNSPAAPLTNQTRPVIPPNPRPF
jgi:hypothetical protein